ncbi:hypothetical protein [Aggregatibacter actinomycetemcomitans]|uniref:hypothetical protein n=1 Tax=Aggregatibacter actinomycetemcomitans TaxID=714 RepID=UPI00023FEEA2|nr:hypothetical protein [Aggregatibacter actinomycetemcomitans]EHK91414.1 hypothetical protein RHAA1_02194 [Aggregatibacter actinomycetemcomitans RhAA1]MBN6069758.1 hypothetical protein [Aggregatibacter actinomycetemcomitans]MBN6078384.1 hypothetical protein [Aggregatibacter actinomycetemcomitans]
MTSREQLLKKQHELDVLMTAWMAEKKKNEVVTFQRPNGDIIEHHPDGKIRVIEYAK